MKLPCHKRTFNHEVPLHGAPFLARENLQWMPVGGIFEMLLDSAMPSDQFTHFDKSGNAHMVDVGPKAESSRSAQAFAKIRMRPATLAQIVDQSIGKGDVLGIARIAGINGAKQCSTMIPLCHPVRLTAVTVDFNIDQSQSAIEINATIHAVDRTGPEMEALMAASTAALTIYDMCKSVDRGMEIDQVYLLKKSGGKSGEWSREQS